MNFLVIEGSEIVATDILETIREVWQDAVIRRFAASLDAAAEVENGAAVDVAILSRPYAELAADGFLDMLARRGVALVLTGDSIIRDLPDLPLAVQVPQPFTADMLQAAIASVTRTVRGA